MLNLRDKVKILDLLKGDMYLAKVRQCCGKNESNIHSTALNSVHLEHLWFFFSGGLLGTIYLCGYQGSIVFPMYHVMW
jgi:hypothetical protein